MRNLLSKETESNFSILGIYQVIGGSVGILIMLWGIFNNFETTLLSILLYSLILLFFSYSIYCGLMCLLKRKSALPHSLANQLLQVLGFSIAGYAYNYIAGVYMTINLDFTNSINVSVGFGLSSFKFYINNDQDQFQISLNIVAILIIYWIDKLMSKVKEEAALRQINSLGDA